MEEEVQPQHESPSPPHSKDRCYHATRQDVRLCLKFCTGIIALALLGAAIAVGLAFSVIRNVKAHVEDARLNTFTVYTSNYSGAGFFAGNISVAIAVRNPNWAMSFEYAKPLVATLVFFDRHVHSLTVVSEGRKHRRFRTRLHLNHTSWEVPSSVLDTAALVEFKKQNATGVFEMVMRLSGEIKFLAHKRVKPLHLSCPLRLQVAPPGREVVGFPPVECQPRAPENIYF